MILPVEKGEAKDNFELTTRELLSLHLILILTDTVRQMFDPYIICNLPVIYNYNSSVLMPQNVICLITVFR